MSEQVAVLYDVPGPRARSRTTIATVVAAVLLAFTLYWFGYRPLASAGELSMDKWGPLVDPGHDNFAAVWRRIGEGFRATLLAALFAIVSSLLFGTFLAVLRMQLKALRGRRFRGLGRMVAVLLRALGALLGVATRVFVEVFRGIPVVLTIFFTWRVLPEFGLRPPTVPLGFVELPSLLWTLVIGLTLYNGVVIGEILRSGMEGLPGGQREAAQAIGLTSLQTTTRILLPQAYRVMLPALISQLVVVLKDTALGFIILYPEVMRVANLAADALRPRNPIQLYAVVGTIFIVVNYTLSRLALYLERRLARGRRDTAVRRSPVPTRVGAPVGR